MTDLPWLTILGIVPLVGALVVAALPAGRDALAKQVALPSRSSCSALTIVMCAAFEPDGDRFQFVQAYDWIPAFGVQYAVGADGIALVLIALIAVLVPVVVLASWYDADPQADPLRRERGRHAARLGDRRRRPGRRRRPTPRRRQQPPRRRRSAAGGSAGTACSTRRRPRRRRSTSCRRGAASRRSSRCCSCSRR